MQFAIGTRVYSVRRKWNLLCDGERIDGLCSYSTRTIWLDGNLAADVAVSVLRHEHTHAWEFELCSPRTDEERCNFNSTVAESFEFQFQAQGGPVSLDELPIEGIANAERAALAPAREFRMSDRVSCGRCGADVMSGSIPTGDPILSQAGVHLVDRGFRCPVCDAVQVWQERSTADGLPLGEFYRPRILVGDEADEWLRSHHREFAPFNAA